MTKRSVVSIVTLCAGVAVTIPAQTKIDFGTNARPAMGWSAWNFSRGDTTNLGKDPAGRPYTYNEAYCKTVADSIVGKGLRDLGYAYIMIPSTRNMRDAHNGLIPQWPARWPNGYRPAIDYLHLKGLKACMYTDGGESTCGPGGETGGNYGNEQRDADTFFVWGADMLKMDWCGGSALGLVPRQQYATFAQALVNSTKRNGRSMQLEICCWGMDNPWEWAYNVGSFWRTAGDIDLGYGGNDGTGSTWECLLRNIEANRHPASAGPNKGWNFADMLEVGVTGGLNETEERSMFGLWCLMASPLILGNDVVHPIPQYALDIVTNKEAVAIDQDSLGIQGDKVRTIGTGSPITVYYTTGASYTITGNNLEVWSKPLVNGSRAVGLFNKTAGSASITVQWSDIGLSPTQQASVRDVWARQDIAAATGSYSATVASHALALLKITPQGSTAAAGRGALPPGRTGAGVSIRLIDNCTSLAVVSSAGDPSAAAVFSIAGRRIGGRIAAGQSVTPRRLIVRAR